MVKKAISIRDIASEVGMSEATVSLALNGSKLVKTETKEKIKETAERLGYVPNASARRLVLKKSGMIGVIVPEIENIYYSVFVKELSEQMSKVGYSLSIFISSNDPVKEERAVSDMIAARVEAMIYVPVNSTSENETTRRMIMQSGIPAVCATTQIDGMCSVRCDMEGGMHLLMKHVLQTNPERIVYFSGPDGVFALDCRKREFLKATKDTGVAVDVRTLPSVDYRYAYEETGTLLANLPDVIVCVNDFMALGVVNRLIEHGVSVPHDVIVTGFDDTIFSIASPVPLTTVRQDMHLMAEKTVNLLLKMIETPEFCEDIRIPTELIVRRYTEEIEK